MHTSSPCHVRAQLRSRSMPLKHGVTVNAQNCSFTTHGVVNGQGAAGIVDRLLREGADETIVDTNGNKPANVIGTRRLEEGDASYGEDVTSCACAFCWTTLRPTEHGVAEATWSCAALTWTDCSRGRKWLLRDHGRGQCEGDRRWRLGRCGGEGTILLKEEGTFRTIVGYL